MINTYVFDQSKHTRFYVLLHTTFYGLLHTSFYGLLHTTFYSLLHTTFYGLLITKLLNVSNSLCSCSKNVIISISYIICL